jgi:hypothetical protein
MARKQQSNLHLIYIAVGFLVLGILLYAITRFYIKYNENALASSIEDDVRHLKQMDEINKVCIPTEEYEKLLARVKQQQTPQQPSQQTYNVSTRDYRVLQDPLYPPLNRTDAVTHQSLENQIERRNMYVPTNDALDTYRVVGYLVNKDATQDAGGNNWKLFARQKDRYMADFYMIPANNNYDIKIQITNDMLKGDKLRDVYTIPTSLTIDSPMLNKTPYQFVEIPKADLVGSGTRYM